MTDDHTGLGNLVPPLQNVWVVADLVVTNYYESPDMRPFQGRRNLDSQIERVRRIEARIAHDRVSDATSGWAWAQRLLRDHSIPVCRHRPNQATLWSLVADLSGRRIAYCLGAPCRNEFDEWKWPSHLG